MPKFLTRIVVLSTIFLAPAAWAFTFTPLSQTFDPSGPGASRSFQVHNESEESVAVDIRLATRDMDPDGNETSEKIPGQEKSFLLFPPQLVLKPNETKTVRVTWVGDPKLEHELAFRIVAEQLPVETKKREQKSANATINILLKYVGAIYVTPKEAHAKIVVKEASFTTVTTSKGKKEPRLALTFQNEGTAHRTLNNFIMKAAPVPSDGTVPPITLSRDELKSLDGQNILAGKSRRFQIPWPESLRKGPVKVDLEFKE